jgi:hypothetical protein
MNRLCVVAAGMLMICSLLSMARHSLAERLHGSTNAQVQFVGTWKLVSTEESLRMGVLVRIKMSDPTAQAI